MEAQAHNPSLHIVAAYAFLAAASLADETNEPVKGLIFERFTSQSGFLDISCLRSLSLSLSLSLLKDRGKAVDERNLEIASRNLIPHCTHIDFAAVISTRTSTTRRQLTKLSEMITR